MSLFKARDWWSAKVGSDEVFDQGSLCVACIDNKHPTHDKVIVGSLNGIVRIYDPKSHADDDKGQSMLLEMQLPQPILGLETGQFVSASEGIHLAVLHPRKLAVYSLSGSQGAVEHGSHYQLNAMYEHNLQRTSCNMTKGNFGGVKGKEFLCVQSMDGTVSFFEQESFSFSRFLPGFLLPGPIKYMQRTDSFVTISSSWQVESYRYQVLAVASDSGNNKNESQNISKGKRINVDWTFNIGEPVIDIFVFNQPQTPTSILILGEHSFVCLKENGNLKFLKKLEYNPSCFCPYASVSEGSINTMIGTYTSQLMIYQDIQLKWTAKLDYIPICIQSATFRDLTGAVVSLDEDGHLMCSYLGTDPSTFSVPPPDSREINYAEQDEEMRNLQMAIRKALGRTDPIPAKMTDSGVTIKASVPNRIDTSNSATLDTEVKDDDPIPSVIVKLSVTSNTSVQNATLLVYAPSPLAANQATFKIPFIDSSAPAEVTTSFFMKGNCLPSSLTAKATATFMLPNGAPRVSHCEFKLPFKLTCKACAPFSTALHKITLDTNKSPINLTEIFADMGVESAGGNGNAIAFQVYGGPKTVILASKSSQRYRLQSDVFESMWLMLKELIDRLVIYHKNAGVKGFECSYSGSLPVTEYCQIIDAHLELRVNHERYMQLLDQRAKQFRAIQRRLLTRFKDKTPAPLNNLDTLLDGTYRQILKLAEGVEENQKAMVRCCMGLSCATLIITTLMKLLYKLSDSEMDVLQSALSHHVPVDSEQGWEEVTDAALTNLLRTCLAKTAKDQVVNPVSLTKPSDSIKLNKHLHQVCERLGKGGRLIVPGQKDQGDLGPRKTTGNPTTNGQEANRDTENKDFAVPQVSIPSYQKATGQEANGPVAKVATLGKDVHELPDLGANENHKPLGQLPSVGGGHLGALPALDGPGLEPLAIRTKKKKKKKKSSHAEEGDGSEAAIDSILEL
ncbi:protein PTHB1-like [Anneissia japonica]|uniref:protein PTHB1-like n=1 Tax=Anneissia japonica TaxID=1529436 RepID=UPI001425B283|nr:protein PTHB1-like [Anneissia japonica]XP_033097654.1 protein PTHB1-like [Anneissia japonica]